VQDFNAHGGLLSLRSARDVQADPMVVSWGRSQGDSKGGSGFSGPRKRILLPM
jgi:hypothetical protein